MRDFKKGWGRFKLGVAPPHKYTLVPTSPLFAFSLQISTYPTSPVGDTVAITSEIVKKYALVSADNYKPAANQDIPGNDLFGEGKKPWTQDVGQLRFLCNVNPLCVGYTSEGFLKNSTKGIQPKTGVTVYLKA